jgi:hypothetical protein
MTPFDPTQARHGVVLRGIDPASLQSNRPELEQSRLEDQRHLIATGTPRHTLIQVNCEGIILQGNHGARAAAEAGIAIDVRVLDFPHPSYGPILSIPIVKR